MSSRIKQKDAAELAAGRAHSHQVVDVAGMVAFGVSAVWLAVQIARASEGHGWLLAFTVLLGYFAADFVSGFVHWMGDTWGSSETPVVGKIFVRTFRHHHVDQLAITRHTFVEVNGSNCLISSPLLMLALFLPTGASAAFALFVKTFALALCMFIFATNQFHKWAHMAQPPRVVALLQRLHLILPPEHHAVHHAAPYNKYYCITVGWLNAPLHWIGFFPALERMITATTGMLPRRDDIGDAAALEIAEREGVLAQQGRAEAELLDEDPAAAEKRVGLWRR